MATLENGGSAKVANGALVVSTAKKYNEYGYAVPVGDEMDVKVVDLADVELVSYTRAGQKDVAGAVEVVHSGGKRMVLRLQEADALELVAAIKRDVYDTDGVDSDEE